MKRICLCLIVLLLLLGCDTQAGLPSQMQPTFQFYYRTAVTEFDSDEGVIRPQTRELDVGELSLSELFSLYMEGPLEDETLILPFPKESALLSTSRRQGLIELCFDSAYLSASAVDISIADACIAKTAFELDNVIRVRILVTNSVGSVLKDSYLEKDEILLFDEGDEPGVPELTLFFADSAGRYLLADRRTFPYTEDEVSMPQYVVEQLIEGPKTSGLFRTLPEGTALLDVNVENGICAVDFNRDFYINRPTTERAEQLTLLSVVNSLCAIDGIDQVQFYVEGRQLSDYSFLNISSPFRADSTAVGPIRSDLNEFDGTLFLPAQDGDTPDTRLHELCVRIRMTGSQSRLDALVHTLLTRPSQNGLVNPFSTDTANAEITLYQGICSVDFSENPFPGDSPESETAALRSVVATLVFQPEIYRVQLSVQGAPLSFSYLEPSESYLTTNDWFCSSP